MKVDFNDYSIVLKKFLTHVESIDLIWDFILDAGDPSYDVAEEVGEVNGYSDALLELGNTEREEVTNIYHILRYSVDNNVDIPRGLALSYSTSNKYQDKAREFNNRVVLVLIDHIEAYLTKVGIDMGLDEQTKFNITVNNGQVNLASDNAMIQATQNNGVDPNAMQLLVNDILTKIDNGVSAEQKQEVEESLELITEQVESSNPKRRMISMALTGLKAIKGSTEFAAAVATLAQFLQPMLH